MVCFLCPVLEGIRDLERERGGGEVKRKGWNGLGRKGAGVTSSWDEKNIHDLGTPYRCVSSP